MPFMLMGCAAYAVGYMPGMPWQSIVVLAIPLLSILIGPWVVMALWIQWDNKDFRDRERWFERANHELEEERRRRRLQRRRERKRDKRQRACAP